MTQPTVPDQGGSSRLPARVTGPAALARFAADGFEVVSFNPNVLDEECLALLPLSTGQRLRALPLDRTGTRVRVAVVDPTDLNVTDDLRLALGAHDVHVVVASEALIDAALMRWARLAARASEGEALKDLAGEEEDEVAVQADEEGRMARLVNQLIDSAADLGASDLHLEPAAGGLVARFRVDGVMQFHATYPRSVSAGIVNRLKVLSAIDVAERRVPQDGRFHRTTANRTLDCRVVTLPTSLDVEGAVIRLLDQGRGSRDLTSVGFRPEFVERLGRALAVPHGIVLVTGPTGSGKTTTLYAALEEVARPERKTLSIEDPVEIRYPGITQVQVNEKAGLTFATALRSFLRADPDVILVGEIRDHETAELAAQAALTGHLVLSTLHTNEAVGAATRLSEMGLEGFVIASALRAVVAQRLLRRLCESCRRPYNPTYEELDRLDWDSSKLPRPEVFYRSSGCIECNETGYRGRLAVGELVLVDEDLAQAVVDRRPSSELERIARAGGTVPIHTDALARLADGSTSVDEVERIGV